MKLRHIKNQELIGGQHYRHVVRRRLFLLAGLGAALFVSICFDLSLGPASIPLVDVVRALFLPGTVTDQVSVVVRDIRLPVAAMAVVVGAALAIAGAQMQTILNNPLASPFTLGISAAAGFGASLVLAFGITVLPVAAAIMVPVNAFIMAMLAALVIHMLSMRRGANTQTIVLLGIAMVFSFNALLALVQFLASSEGLAAVVFWTMGSLTKATWPKFFVVSAILVIVLPVFIRRAWAMTAMRMGDDKAASFGIRVGRLRLETMLLVSLLAAIPVSFVGTIGFVGLVGPHIARLMIGEDQRFFLPASALAGALLLSASSVASKTLISGAILPIGIVTSLVGIPFFVSLVLTNSKKLW